MTWNNRISIALVAFTISAFILYVVFHAPGELTDHTVQPSRQALAPARGTIDADIPEAATSVDDALVELPVDLEALPEGVNLVFHDKPEIQVGWMQRGKDILLKNHPKADHAEFRETFFHRGFKGRAMTCGEVRLSKDGKVIADFQRFIFTGGFRTRLESDVINFDILWQKQCIETLDEYFDQNALPGE